MSLAARDTLLPETRILMSNSHPIDKILAKMHLTKEQTDLLNCINEQLKGMTRAEGEQYAASICRQCEQ